MSDKHVLAEATSGLVIAAMSPGVARQLAVLWARAHAIDPARGLSRPRWPDEVAELFTAAADAEEQTGTPRLTPPHLSLVPMEATR